MDAHRRVRRRSPQLPPARGRERLEELEEGLRLPRAVPRLTRPVPATPATRRDEPDGSSRRVVRELPLSYAVLSEARQCGPASAVHERRPTHLTAPPPGRPLPQHLGPRPSRPLHGYGCISRLAGRARSSFSRNTVTAPAARVIATMRRERSGSRRWSSWLPNATRNRHGLASPPPRSSPYASPSPT